MKIETEIKHNVRDLIKLKKEQILEVNHEYQRAPVWTRIQEQLFIDSIFRGYSIPAFYFHRKQSSVGGYKKDILEIIDGQQRINAMYRYSEGGYDLKMNIKFPDFFQGQNYPWTDRLFQDISDDLQCQFYEQKVVIFFIETEDNNEIRDLFIRLQGGTPLTPQDKRDSWPGCFTKYILRLGGKHGVEKYPGDPFFKKIAKPSGGESNKRKLAAQIAMLYSRRREGGEPSFCGIKSQDIDEFYHRKIDFNPSSQEAKRFKKILEKLTSIFENAQITLKGKGHYAIHLVLLADSLLDDYAPGWENKLPRAFRDFDKTCLEVKKARKARVDLTEKQEKYYESYVRWTGNEADLARTIQRRHDFFVEKMLLLLNPTKKDSRNFSRIDKELVYYRDKQICQVCKMRDAPLEEVHWDDAEFHHIKPHSEGGESTLENGALVHQQCHPRSAKDVSKFQEWWVNREQETDNTQEEEGNGQNNLQFPPPEGTECRFQYEGRYHYGRINDRKLQVDDRDYTSFSGASAGITGTARNGWNDWELKLPGQNEWISANDWRMGH